MGLAKVAITIDDSTLQKLGRLVKEHVFPNRSKAIQEAVQNKIKRIEKSRLARECAKLDPLFEQAGVRSVRHQGRLKAVRWMGLVASLYKYCMQAGFSSCGYLLFI
jgi:Arc/MetJ-type ribon-helix-helix transcriptional regulator